MPIPLLLALLATCLASTAGQAQHGTPFDLRNMTPTIEDAEPGREPGPEGKSVPEIYRRQPVFYRTNEAPGTVIIDTSERFLYLVQGNNTALRYGIGVGRDGFQWNGLLKVTRKAEWPDWTPPAEMIERQPYLPRSWPAARAIPWARARSISATPCTASTAPTRRRPSATRCLPAVSGWSTSRSKISMTA
jgi:lipoprotein-anchoring transpeptidase ErfK/SrfK